MSKAGTGRLGAYTDCTFRVSGTGRFMPTNRAHPHIGRKGTLEHVAEARLESIVPEEAVAGVVDAIRESHPYEEPAFDIYPLENRRRDAGLGRWGTLPEPVTVSEFVAEVSRKLNAPGIRYTGDGAREVSKVAVCGGAGSGLYRNVLRCGCEVFITGDVKYHGFLDACAEGLILVDAGHAETELPGVRALSNRLRAARAGVEVLLSEAETRIVKHI